MTWRRYEFDLDQLRAWYEQEHASVREIGRRLGGVSERTVWRHMTEAGIAMRKPGPVSIPGGHRRVLPEERSAILAARARGSTQADAAKQFGRSAATVRRIEHQSGNQYTHDRHAEARKVEDLVRAAHARGLRGRQIDRELGFPIGKAGPVQRRLGLGRRPAPTPPPDELRRLYKSLGTVKDVATAIGKNRTATATLLKRAGVQIRRGGTRRPHRLDRFQDQIRRARLEERIAIPVLAARYGCTQAQMAHYLQTRGIVSYKILTSSQHAQLGSMAAAGTTPAEIGRRLGFSATTIRKHLMKPAPRPRLK